MGLSKLLVATIQRDYNGFKLVLNQNSFFGEDIQKLGNFASKGYSKTYDGFSKSVEIK